MRRSPAPVDGIPIAPRELAGARRITAALHPSRRARTGAQATSPWPQNSAEPSAACHACRGDVGKVCHNCYHRRRAEEIKMPTRNISLTPEQDAFVEKVVKTGEYQNASEAVRDALRVLQQRRREDALKLKVLRMQIKAGVDALERGEFVEIDESDLEGCLEGLAAGLGKHAR
jgi:antitoxin ParD1/3/4